MLSKLSRGFLTLPDLCSLGCEVNKISLVIHEMIPFEAMQLSIVQKFLRLVNGNKRLEQDILVIYHKWSMPLFALVQIFVCSLNGCPFGA